MKKLLPVFCILLSMALLAGCAALPATQTPAASDGVTPQQPEDAAAESVAAPESTPTEAPMPETPAPEATVAPEATDALPAPTETPLPPVDEAQIYALNGKVYLDSGDVHRLCHADMLTPKDVLTAMQGATASVSLGQNAFMMMDGNTRVQVDTIERGELGVTLEGGTLLCYCGPEAAVLRVRALTDVFVSPGTVCAVTMGDKLDVTVYMGGVLLDSGNTRMEVGTDNSVSLAAPNADQSVSDVAVLTAGVDLTKLPDAQLEFLVERLDGEETASEFFTACAMLQRVRAEVAAEGEPQSEQDWAQRPAEAE